MKRTYENAIKILETRRRKARPKATTDKHLQPEIPTANGAPMLRGKPSLVGMREWLRALGYSDGDVNAINIIHIAGTKGKGSTCAFVRSFLLAHGFRTGFPGKIGMYTSPDLRHIRERIQINDRPVLRDLFTKYFFEVWDQLSAHGQQSGHSEGLPHFLQLLNLVALHTFIREEVEAAIIETHNGGEYDATNVVQKPIITGITALGMDHVAQLGPTIENVAWHKAGIFKAGSLAFSVCQESGPADILRARAAEKGVVLTFVPVNSSIIVDSPSTKVPVQRINSSLALAIANAFLKSQQRPSDNTMSQEDIYHGIERFCWPGRFEIIADGNVTWLLDGAHNELSVQHAAEWFASNTADAQISRILIFSHLSEERDGPALLECLARSLLKNGARPQYVIFTTQQGRLDGTTRIDKTLKVSDVNLPDFCKIYNSQWLKIDPTATVLTEATIEGALKRAKEIGDGENGVYSFVTGSLHTVGEFLNLLQPHD